MRGEVVMQFLGLLVDLVTLLCFVVFVCCPVYRLPAACRELGLLWHNERYPPTSWGARTAFLEIQARPVSGDAAVTEKEALVPSAQAAQPQAPPQARPPWLIAHLRLLRWVVGQHALRLLLDLLAVCVLLLLLPTHRGLPTFKRLCTKKRSLLSLRATTRLDATESASCYVFLRFGKLLARLASASASASHTHTY